MGILAKTLSSSSAFAARKSELWPDLMDRLESCLYPTAIDDFERHVVSLGLSVPDHWHEHIEEAVERKRKEITEENITKILSDRFDF